MDQTLAAGQAALDPIALRAALGQFATGVTVITTQSPSGPVGFTANSFASVSLDPPLVLWSPARSSSRYGVFAEAAYFSIHILGQDQIDLGNRFHRGGSGFDGLQISHTPNGTPVLHNTLARFDCTQHATFDGGDHLIILGRVLHFETSPGAPLLFAQGKYGAVAR